jgi:iron(III) transport system substrate-binding protein
VGIAIVLAFAAGCRPDSGAGDIVAYVAHDPIHSGPILKTFEDRTGLRIQVVGDTEASKTTGLANRLLERKDSPEADVFWNNEVMQTVRLAEAGLFEVFVPPTAAGIPPRYCDPAGRWVGFAARARVILYNTNLVKAGEAPASIFALTEPRFRGKVVMAYPVFGTTATHVAALFAHLGAEKAKAFLRALKANDVHIADGNAMACRLVSDGHYPICLTDTDDANGAIQKGKPVSIVYPDQDGLGTLVIPNTVALLRGAPHAEAGKRLVEYLASPEVEERLARSRAAQMPLRPGVAPHSELFDFSRIKAMDVDWTRVAAAADESFPFVRAEFRPR